MNTYFVEKTPIDGVLKLGEIESSPVLFPEETYLFEGEVPSFFKDGNKLLQELGHFLLPNYVFKDFVCYSWIQPDGSTYNWHTDKTAILFMCATEDESLCTEFKINKYEIFQAKPWTIYYMRGDIEHRTPLKFKKSSSIKRIFYRLFIEGI
jgi:hypothetical protein